MRHARLSGAVALSLATLLLAGCVAGRPTHLDQASVVPAASGSPATSSAPPLSTRDQRRLPKSAVQLVERTTQGHNPRKGEQESVATNLAAVGARGEILSGHVVTDMHSLLTTSATYSLQADGKSVTIPWKPAFKGSYWITSDVSPRWVVWQESDTTTLNSMSWQISAYNRLTGEVSHLADDLHMSDGSPPPQVPGYTGVVIADDAYAYWVQADGVARHPHANLYGCALADCSPRLIRRDTAFLSGDGGSVRALTFGSNRKLVDSKFRVTVVETTDLHARKVGRINIGPLLTVTGFAHGSLGDLLTLKRSGGTQLTSAIATRPDGSKRWEVDGKPGEFFGYPLVTDHYFAWAESSGTGATHLGGYFMRPNSSVPYSIGNSSGLYGIVGKGPYLSWQDKSRRTGEISWSVVKLKH